MYDLNYDPTDEAFWESLIKERPFGASPRQVLYARYRREGFNQSTSAQKAGYASSSAAQESSKLERNEKVRLLQDLLDNLAAGPKKQDVIPTREETLKQIKRLAHSASNENVRLAANKYFLDYHHENKTDPIKVFEERWNAFSNEKKSDNVIPLEPNHGNGTQR